MSTQNPTHGTKVKDPTAPNIREGAGPVASDSLAASSSEFAKNRNSEALGVAGSNSTFANTNISGAETLAPTTAASARPDDENATIYQPQNPDSSGTTGSRADPAPTYVTNPDSYQKLPKGRNLTEGEFDSQAKNASWGTDIGGSDDPGRRAVEELQVKNSRAGGGVGGIPAQKDGSGENVYEALEGSEEV